MKGLVSTRLCLSPRVLNSIESVDLDVELYSEFYYGLPTPQVGQPVDHGFWIIEWQGRREFIGWCALLLMEDGGEIELGYKLVSAARGQGVATEAARTVLDYAFGEANLESVVAVHRPDNHASRRVLEKLGFRRTGIKAYGDRILPFYRLARRAGAYR